MTTSQNKIIKRTALAAIVAFAGFGVLTPAVANAADVDPGAAPRASSDVQWKQRSTKVTVRNDGDRDMYVRERKNMRWYSPETIKPGYEEKYTGYVEALDDVELNVFYDKGKADRNEGGINVDAENPVYSTPWMSVDWDSEYFNEGSTHTWVPEHGEGSRFWGKRENDSSSYKEFRLHVTNK